MPLTRTLRGNLLTAEFPVISNFQGRTVIIPGLDQMNRQQEAANPQAQDVPPRNQPHLLYAHNVWPTAFGIQSIGYQEFQKGLKGVTDFDICFSIYDNTGKYAFFVPAGGLNYTLTGNFDTWQSLSPLPPNSFPANGLVTVTHVVGRSFIFYEGLKMIEFDFTNEIYLDRTLFGLDAANIKGICSSFNYLIAFNRNVIYWSSTTDPQNFVPSLITGAGSQSPGDLKGEIVNVLPVISGFIIYTTNNAVLASYSGNVRFPWLFREIPNSSGIESYQDVSWEANLSFHYAFTNSGLMKVDRNLADQVFPDISDFIAGRIYEEYDEVTEVFTVIYSTAKLSHRLAFIGSRYMVISYGLTNVFEYALVFDTTLKRWGKLKITHVDCFDFTGLNFYGPQTYSDLSGVTYNDLSLTTYADLSDQQTITTEVKHDMAFLQPDGTIQIVNPEFNFTTSRGVALYGKYQLERSGDCTFTTLDVENMEGFTANEFSVRLLTSTKGKTPDLFESGYLLQSNGPSARYGFRLTGLNHILRFLGRFNLVSFVLTVLPAGKRPGG